MKLESLLHALGTAVELGCEGARRQYTAHLERMATERADLPGKPLKLAVAPIATVFPSKVSFRVPVALSWDGGELQAELVPRGKPGKRRWYHHADAEAPDLPVTELVIECEPHRPPEALARIRDQHDRAQDVRLRDHFAGPEQEGA